MIRKKFSIAGAIVGVAYTAFGMATLYRNDPVTDHIGWLILAFAVIALFAAPLGGALGLGIGILAEGLFNSFRKQK